MELKAGIGGEQVQSPKAFPKQRYSVQIMEVLRFGHSYFTLTCSYLILVP